MQLIKNMQKLIVLILGLWAAVAANAAETISLSAKANETLSIALKPPADCIHLAGALATVTLEINGVSTGLHPMGCERDSNQLWFELRRNPAAEDAGTSATAWRIMQGRPWESDHSFNRKLNFAVVQENQSAPLVAGSLMLKLLDTGTALIGVGLVLAVWLSITFLGKKSGLVRDADDSGRPLQRRSYSLGRVQMAWWFCVIFGAYVFLWVITGDLPIVSSQSLWLMGLSGATGLSAAGLDSGKQTRFPVSSGRFFDDLLTDASGVTIYRFQMLVMTVALGLFFIIHVLKDLAMPELDSGTLTLMGISSGTYVGFKVPERHVAGPASSGGQASAEDDPKRAYGTTPETGEGA